MNRRKIAERLVSARGERSRASVCKQLGISLSALTMYELGERIPRDDIKKKMAILYGMTVDELFFA